MRALFCALFVISQVGCASPCQQLCAELADYASDTCGVSFTKDEEKACRENFSRKNTNPDWQEECAESLDTLDAIESEWSCADVEEYF